MKCISLFFSIGLGLLASCTQQAKDDPEELKKVLVAYFDGIETRDLQKMKENTTADYLLFESGKVWNNDSLWKELQTLKDQRIQFRLDNFRVKVDNESGSIVYFNNGDVYSGDTLKFTMEWIENATFQKVDGKWKVDFLQSTVRSK